MPYGVPKGAKNPHQGDHPIRGGSTKADNNYHPPRQNNAAKSNDASATGPKNVTNLPITYNPGVHKTMLHDNNPISGQPRRPFKGTMSTYMVQTATFPSTRYGFRFHWNPQQVQISTAMDTTVDANPIDAFRDLQTYPHQQQVSFDVLLHRAQDMGESDRNNFYPPVNQAQLQQIYERGTNADIEFIFRAINGTSVSVDGGYYTSDVGYFSGNILQVNFSPKWQFTGFVTNMVVTHLQFTVDMIPIHSQVHFDMIRVSQQVVDAEVKGLKGTNYLDTLPVPGQPPLGQGRDEGTRTTPLVQPPKPAPISRSKTRPI